MIRTQREREKGMEATLYKPHSAWPQMRKEVPNMIAAVSALLVTAGHVLMCSALPVGVAGAIGECVYEHKMNHNK